MHCSHMSALCLVLAITFSQLCYRYHALFSYVRPLSCTCDQIFLALLSVSCAVLICPPFVFYQRLHFLSFVIGIVHCSHISALLLYLRLHFLSFVIGIIHCSQMSALCLVLTITFSQICYRYHALFSYVRPLSCTCDYTFLALLSVSCTVLICPPFVLYLRLHFLSFVIGIMHCSHMSALCLVLEITFSQLCYRYHALFSYVRPLSRTCDYIFLALLSLSCTVLIYPPFVLYLLAITFSQLCYRYHALFSYVRPLSCTCDYIFLALLSVSCTVLICPPLSCICDYIFLALLSVSCTVLICPPFVLYLRLHFLRFVIGIMHCSHMSALCLVFAITLSQLCYRYHALFSYVRPLSCTCDYIFLALLSVSCIVLICPPFLLYLRLHFLSFVIGIMHCSHMSALCLVLAITFSQLCYRYHALFSYVRPLSCTCDYIFLALLSVSCTVLICPPFSCICDYIFLALLSVSCTVLICPPFVLYLRLHFLSFVIGIMHCSHMSALCLVLAITFSQLCYRYHALFSYVRPLSCTCDYIFLALLSVSCIVLICPPFVLYLRLHFLSFVIGIMHCSHMSALCLVLASACNYIFLALLSVSCTVLICPPFVLYLRLHFLSFVIGIVHCSHMSALVLYLRLHFLSFVIGIMHCSHMSALCLVFAITFSQLCYRYHALFSYVRPLSCTCDYIFLALLSVSCTVLICPPFVLYLRLHFLSFVIGIMHCSHMSALCLVFAITFSQLCYRYHALFSYVRPLSCTCDYIFLALLSVSCTVLICPPFVLYLRLHFLSFVIGIMHCSHMSALCLVLAITFSQLCYRYHALFSYVRPLSCTCDYIFLALLSVSCTVLICPPFVLYLRLHFLSFVIGIMHCSHMSALCLVLAITFSQLCYRYHALFSYVRPLSCICDYIFLALLSVSCTVLICPPFVLYLRLHFLSFVIGIMHCSHMSALCLVLAITFSQLCYRYHALFSYVRPLSCTCDYIFLALLSVSCTVLICPPFVLYLRLHFLSFVIGIMHCSHMSALCLVLAITFSQLCYRYHALFSYVRPLSCTCLSTCSQLYFLSFVIGIMHCSHMSALCLVLAITFSQLCYRYKNHELKIVYFTMLTK